VKKLLLLFPLFVLAVNMALAQDDELPPPSSKPKQTEEKRNDQKPPDVKDFKGFSKPKKFDMSKLLIEPIVNLSIGQVRTDIGFSPSVAYRVWQPKNAKPKSGNVGLFVGGGVTYSYTHINETANLKYNIQTYGAGPLIQYTIWRGLFARVKLELLGRKIPVSYYTIPTSTGGVIYKVNYINKFTPACLIGAGYNLLQSKNIFIPLIVSYDILHSVVDKNYSVYPRGFTVQLGFITLF
jgi:hypothetical protein